MSLPKLTIGIEEEYQIIDPIGVEVCGGQPVTDVEKVARCMDDDIR